MPRKNLVLGLLVVLNLVLLTAVVTRAVRPRLTFAQPANISSNYLAIAAEIQNGYDALYVIDTADRRLHMLAPSKGREPRLQLLASRDLNSDFRVKVTP